MNLLDYTQGLDCFQGKLLTFIKQVYTDWPKSISNRIFKLQLKQREV